MNKRAIEIMGEFDDDIQRVCDALDEALETIEEKEKRIEELEEEMANHECTV